MTGRALKRGVVGLFLLVVLVLFIWFNVSKPRILILHSYDASYPWVRDVNVGLKRVFAGGYRYQLRWYYMDTKRHPDAGFKTSAGVAARQMIDAMQPDVIIACDDDAQQYVGRYYLNHPHIQIVFAGVNKEASDYGYHRAANVTGILERMPLVAIRETLQLARLGGARLAQPRLALLGDGSETVSGDLRQASAFDWSPVRLTAVRQVDNWPQWQAAVLALGQQADAILVSGYRRLRRSRSDATLVGFEEVARWTEAHSPVPVLASYAFYADEGGMLAIGASPFEQGEVAARMALAIVIDGQRANHIPVATSQDFIIAMNGKQMQARGLALPLAYAAAARIGGSYLP